MAPRRPKLLDMLAGVHQACFLPCHPGPPSPCMRRMSPCGSCLGVSMRRLLRHDAGLHRAAADPSHALQLVLVGALPSDLKTCRGAPVLLNPPCAPHNLHAPELPRPLHEVSRACPPRRPGTNLLRSRRTPLLRGSRLSA
jgi:hypothetical protein